MVFKLEYLTIRNCHLPNKVPFYSSKCSFLFFWMLRYDSRLFPDCKGTIFAKCVDFLQKNAAISKVKGVLVLKDIFSEKT